MKKILLKETFFALLCFYTVQAVAQGAWTQKVDFGGVGRLKSVGFAIQDKGYIGTGQTSASSFLNDFWEYDPCNLWVRKADFPGSSRTGAVGFSIGGKGYLGLGYNVFGTLERDFYEYDQATDTWRRIADFEVGGRRFAVGFSIGNKGYVCTGEGVGNVLLKELWEYDPALNDWTQLADFPGIGRKYASVFVVNGKAYVGLGTPGPLRDMWEYDPATNTWTQKANYPGVGPEASTTFTLGNYGYLGLGDDYVNFGYDLWRYDPLNNTWTSMANFTGTARESSVGFSLCGKGYFGTGGQGLNTFYRDFWEYTPPDYTGGLCFTDPVAQFGLLVNPECDNSCVSFSDQSANDPVVWQWSFPGGSPTSSSSATPSAVCYAGPGNYTVSLIVAKGACADTIARGLSIPDACLLLTTNDSIICPGSCIGFTMQSDTVAESQLWLFPGGVPATSTLRDPVVCYPNNGSYAVTLISTTNGVIDTITKTDYIIVTDTACGPCPTLTLTYIASVSTGNLNSGAVKITAAGGQPPYTYSLDNANFQSSNIFTSLPLGSYQFYVLDGNGCPGQGSFIIERAGCCAGQ